MKVRSINIAFFFIFVFFGLVYAASADNWHENFNDPNDYVTPSGDPPWTADGTMWTGSYGPFDFGPRGEGGSAEWRSWHVDRPGNGKAFKVYSDCGGEGSSCFPNEMQPFFFNVNPKGVRWKFDLWIGPRSSGAYNHSASGIKFIYMGTDVNHSIHLAGCSIRSSKLRYTNLETGEEGSHPGTLNTNNLHLRLHDNTTWNLNVSRTDFNTLREQWITLEIEVVCGNPAHVKIWVNGDLDFYRIFNGQNFYNCAGRVQIVNYTSAAHGACYLGIDNFYKYDTLRPDDGDATPPEPPSNPEIIRR